MTTSAWSPEHYPMRLGHTLDALGEFASADHQERVWRLGLGPEVSSYEEACCTFLGDFGGGDLIDREWREAELTEVQKEALRRFRDHLEAFILKVSPQPSPEEVLDHAEWPHVRALAHRALLTIGEAHLRER